MSQQPSIYTPGGYQSRRCLLLSVPFGGQDFRNAYGDFRRDRWGTRHRWSEDRWHGQPGVFHRLSPAPRALPDWQRGGRPVALVRRARRHLLTFPHSPGPAPTPEPATVTGREAPASDRRDASHSSPTQPGLDSFSRQARPGHRGGSPCSSYMGAASVPPTRSRCRNPRHSTLLWGLLVAK